MQKGLFWKKADSFTKKEKLIFGQMEVACTFADFADT